MLKSADGWDVVMKGGRLVRGGGTDDEVTVGDNADKSIAASVRCVKDSSRQGLSPSQYSPARFFGLTFYSLIVFSHRLSMNVQKYGMV